MDRKSEAYELVRQGLKNDLKSHVCWHVFGLLYRSDREYREAIKCYRNALRIDPDNIEILRDLSLLQAQMRDLSGFVETRQQLLTLKPNHRMNWIGFSVAHHLNSNGSKAVEILEAYEGTLEKDHPPDNERCEHGEMILYKLLSWWGVEEVQIHVGSLTLVQKISLLEECGFLDRALEELRQKETKIVDKLAFKEQEVSLLVKLGHLEEAETIYRILLSMNPDNYRPLLHSCPEFGKNRNIQGSISHFFLYQFVPSTTMHLSSHLELLSRFRFSETKTKPLLKPLDTTSPKVLHDAF
ncbi:N-alpha-acetyltransferase 15 NatA auxiliary subunit-like protein [Trifolium pratense]|uniref:N-alpha-acetyltransferase 15 NatA auxiliary subunit-like protein n=1 Tax=Trifolium pratense TaxID=57577 RepID=A0A2K3P609_TRIPR|nr:N-alpha-acetyltransferase 15 NatA auxiliary subunit-like protein [Trifolium pratense]